MSKSQPIHHLHRVLRSSPDNVNTSSSYERGSQLLHSREENVETEFHRRLAGNRRDPSGPSQFAGSFWRTSSESQSTQAPSFNSVKIDDLSSQSSKEKRNYSGLIGGSSQAQFNNETVRNWSISGRSESSDSLKSSSRGELAFVDNTINLPDRYVSNIATLQRPADRRSKPNSSSSDFDAGRNDDAQLDFQEDDELDQQCGEQTPAQQQQRSISNQIVHGSTLTKTNGTDGHNHVTGLPSISSTLPLQSFVHLNHITSMDRSSSDQSTGSLFYGKTPNSGTVLGKSSSLIFPTGVETACESERDHDNSKRRRINLLLDQCEAVRFPFKKKLLLSNLSLTEADIPLSDLCGTSLGNSLHKLSLAGNRLGTVPAQLVQSLPALKHLDLSQCELHHLPEKWNLPKLLHLNLSHNRLTDFPEEGMLEGLPDLHELNMYGNKVAEIVVPSNHKVLSKLETLNLGYNDLVFLPDELDQITSLRVLKVMNNYLEKVPMRVCDMDLRTLDVSSNPVIQPPIETCERGICSMKRYYQCLRVEEQTKEKALEEVQKKLQRQKNKNGKTKKGYGAFIKSLSSKTTGKPFPMAARRNLSDDSQSASSSTNSVALDNFGSMNLSSSLPPTFGEPQSVVGRFSSLVSSPMSIATVDAKNNIDMSQSSSAAIEESTAIATHEIFDNTLDDATVNENLKVIFVGMAMVGKTSMIKRLIEGRDAIIPTHDERTVGVDIYEWDPKKDRRFTDIDSRILFQDSELANVCGDVDVKFSVWDFAGQHVYHATHELFFSPRALYVLVWDLGATNRATLKRKNSFSETGAFRLTYDSSDEDEEPADQDDGFAVEQEARRADRALEHDIDEKVQFWVDCIQSSAPGSAILPVASFADYFDNEGGEAEARRRCCMLKQRLLKHEERRIAGIKERLKEYHDQTRADDIGAVRLRKLLCPYTRPKLIFGDDDNDCVVRVSGLRYTGFYELTEKITNIATGRDKGKWLYPIFHGHIGARIPRMRLEVREAVRTMRDRFKVVEWGYFINQLRDHGLTSVEDISDALHFLTSIGELSYFGGVMADQKQYANPLENTAKDLSLYCDTECNNEKRKAHNESKTKIEEEEDEDEIDDDQALLSLDNTKTTSSSTVSSGSTSSLDDLSQFVFLNPRWLVAAVACILRHDLDREIKETRRQAAATNVRRLIHAGSFYDAHINCPVITAEDACMLWQAKRITKKAAERAQEYSNNSAVTPFEFLQLLLIRFGVFVPIDLNIEKVFFGGKEYAHLVESMSTFQCTAECHDTPSEIILGPSSAESARFFFLPSLLGPCEPSDAWTYKSSDSWKITLCHSVLFPDGVPPGLMERLTASVLSSVYAAANQKEAPSTGGVSAAYEGLLNLKEILCWRTAFFIKIGNRSATAHGQNKESIVEIFCHIADRESHLCVGSDYMGVGMRRLIICARGQVGDGGRKIWKGGYLLVLKCARRVMDQYGGLEYEIQAFCPDCLSKKAVSEASSWEFSVVRSAIQNQEDTLRCRHGHRVDTCFLAGPLDNKPKPRVAPVITEATPGTDTVVPVRDLLRAIVVVGLWDGKSQKIVRVGSGFIVDRKRGLIVTASHTLMNIWGDKNYPFGEDYYGLRQGKVVIGIISGEMDSDGPHAKDMAVFRYFAKIVAKDPSLEHGECHLDACILRITTRMESDVGGDGQGCGEQPEILLLNNPRALKNEKLQSLKLTEKCELDEHVRILGYNQGGEGLLAPGESLNRFVDFARGYVCMKFAQGETRGNNNGKLSTRDRFKPREEIVVICPTIGGHSGGPCVNQQGEVIGILSRADPTESQRCYISPTYEWKSLVKQAKNML